MVMNAYEYSIKKTHMLQKK